MRIRAMKALTPEQERHVGQKSQDSEDVGVVTGDTHHPHSPLETSALHPSSQPDGSFSLLQLLMKYICVRLTVVELLCNVSFWMAPVSQFLIFMKRGHLEGLPFCRG